MRELYRQHFDIDNVLTTKTGDKSLSEYLIDSAWAFWKSTDPERANKYYEQGTVQGIEPEYASFSVIIWFRPSEKYCANCGREADVAVTHEDTGNTTHLCIRCHCAWEWGHVAGEVETRFLDDITEVGDEL